MARCDVPETSDRDDGREKNSFVNTSVTKPCEDDQHYATNDNRASHNALGEENPFSEKCYVGAECDGDECSDLSKDAIRIARNPNVSEKKDSVCRGVSSQKVKKCQRNTSGASKVDGGKQLVDNEETVTSNVSCGHGRVDLDKGEAEKTRKRKHPVQANHFIHKPENWNFSRPGGSFDVFRCNAISHSVNVVIQSSLLFFHYILSLIFHSEGHPKFPLTSKRVRPKTSKSAFTDKALLRKNMRHRSTVNYMNQATKRSPSKLVVLRTWNFEPFVVPRHRLTILRNPRSSHGFYLSNKIRSDVERAKLVLLVLGTFDPVSKKGAFTLSVHFFKISLKLSGDKSLMLIEASPLNINDISRFVNSDNTACCFEFTIECPAEVLNQQPPPNALKDANKRARTFQLLGDFQLPIEVLARHGFFCNDNYEIQCHRCYRVTGVTDVVRNPASSSWHYPHCSYIVRLRQVASDGRISDDIRDPPGQQSMYIPPGDVRNEAYRVSTFENFPVPSTSSRRSLAQSGFFFTGFFDRVKCFACGRTVQEWVATDNPTDPKWHKNDCPFMRGQESGNVPIATHFNQLYGNFSTRPAPRNPGEEVIQQRDPVTGAIIRTVRYPADLPERIRQSGGTFEIGPNNQVTIQSGPGTSGRNHGPGLHQAPARLPATPLQQAQHQPMRPWRMANVISADHKRFLTNLYLNRELDRLASYARWPTGRPNVAPAALAKTGFFYLGDMDRTQCFSCGGVLRNWTVEDDAASEHRSHFPNCLLVLGTEARNVPVPNLPVAPEVRQADFPCRFPSNPHMRSEASRVETFDQRWPRNRTAATPAEIAQAGFFYLGERDRVKCWYCNGGLQHWEYDDVPWIEHAKWFPNCQFLLSVKGQHFVYRHLAMCPQLARPIIARQDGGPLDTGSQQRPSRPPEDVPPSIARVRRPSPPPTIIDPQEEMRKKQERIDKVMKDSELVKNVLAMGFSEQIVRQLLIEKVDSGNEESSEDIYGTTVGLLDDVMKREEELKQEEEQRSHIATAIPSMPGPSTSFLPSTLSASMPTPLSSLGPVPGSGKYNVSYFEEGEEGGRDMYGTEPMETTMTGETPAKQLEGSEDPASLQEALNKIEEERMCKVCFSNPADMVFVPCGHMCCCMECTQALRQCPVCRVKIQKAIKTYLS